MVWVLAPGSLAVWLTIVCSRQPGPWKGVAIRELSLPGPQRLSTFKGKIQPSKECLQQRLISNSNFTILNSVLFQCPSER
jgi:hypothetical protein